MAENTIPTKLEGCNSELIKKKVRFGPPPHDGIVKITGRKDNLIIESGEVVQNGDYALIKGYLNKHIFYHTAKKDKLMNLVGEEDQQKNENKNEKKEDKNDKKEDKKDKHGVKCESMEPELECVIIDGVVRHTTLWIPFELLIHVPGAQEGDTVTIKETSVKALYRDDEIVEDGLITGVVINDVINVTIGVSSAGQHHTIRR
ncbi:MAG: hypothetical protein ACRDB0_03565 [Paraclostridium sp.]